MKKHYYALGAALLAGGVLVSGFGAVLKQQLPEDLAFLYEEHSVIALPFALLADGNLRNALTFDFEGQDGTLPVAETGETTADTVQDETTGPIVSTTETVVMEETTDALDTEGVVTEESTVPPTEPTEATIPPTEPSVSLEELYPVIPEPVVGPEYFDDTLFIGDSRMCGLRDYARLGDADYFCDVGMSIFSMWGAKCYDQDFYSTLLSDHLRRVKYGKIYIALGINECGYPVNNFQNQYRSMVEQIREQQPDAVIVLQGIITVTRGYARTLSYFQPDHIAVLNEFISSLADGEKIFYIDPNPAFTDPDGFLMTRITKDGCHLYAKEYALWAQWLRTCPPVP